VSEQFDENVDALRRTGLANERTYLAWWRTGLTAVAVGIGAGGIVPKLVDTEKWGFAAVGIGFGILGVMLLAYGLRRELEVTKAVASGSFAPPDPRVLLFLTGAGVLLGVLTVVVLIISL
jgi:inner membrane protein YidH